MKLFGQARFRFHPSVWARLAAVTVGSFLFVPRVVPQPGEQVNPVPRLDTVLRPDGTLNAPPGFTGNAPGGPSRWSTKRSSEWRPLKPKLVVEVCYDHFTGDRFRHGTRLLRWRPDKAPKQCTLDQVKQKKANLMALLNE